MGIDVVRRLSILYCKSNQSKVHGRREEEQKLKLVDVSYAWSPIARRDGEAVYDHAEQREMAPLPYLLRRRNQD